MNMQTSDRIAFNTIIQYIRLFLNLVIGLYSIRVIFNALGASDYGIYDVIAGVITILGFVNSSLTQTSIRFLSVSLGANNKTVLRQTFNNCFWLHCYIAAILFVVLEIIGQFLFRGYLNIPIERIEASRIVYHCMAATLFLNIFVTPFSALITSHEKFLYASIISIFDSILKLGIAFVLLYAQSDKLILYGILMMGITIVNVLLFIIYNIFKYRDEIHISKPLLRGLKKQTGFAGWTVLDVFGNLATRQGYSIILNKFFGTDVNAVFALSRQVEGQMFNISAAVIDTMKPQIMKSYGANDKERMFRLSMTAGKFGFSLMSLVVIPLFVFMPEILQLWLIKVPEGTVLFTRLMILACMSEQLTRGLVYACQATGHIKYFSIVVSLIRILALPISIFLFWLGLPAYSAIIAFLVCECCGSLARVFVISITESFDAKFFLNEITMRILPPFLISLALLFAVSNYISTIYMLLLSSIFGDVLFVVLFYVISISRPEKQALKSVVNKIKR